SRAASSRFLRAQTRTSHREHSIAAPLQGAIAQRIAPDHTRRTAACASLFPPTLCALSPEEQLARHETGGRRSLWPASQSRPLAMKSRGFSAAQMNTGIGADYAEEKARAAAWPAWHERHGDDDDRITDEERGAVRGGGVPGPEHVGAGRSAEQSVAGGLEHAGDQHRAGARSLHDPDAQTRRGVSAAASLSEGRSLHADAVYRRRLVSARSTISWPPS